MARRSEESGDGDDSSPGGSSDPELTKEEKAELTSELEEAFGLPVLPEAHKGVGAETFEDGTGLYRVENDEVAEKLS